MSYTAIYLLVGTAIFLPMWNTRRIKERRAQAKLELDEYGGNSTLQVTAVPIFTIALWPIVLGFMAYDLMFG